MNIAIFTGFYLPHLGGVERYTEKLISELVNLGYKITIITSNHSNLKKYEKVNKNIEIFRLPSYPIFKDRYPILNKNKEYKTVMKKLNTLKFDFIICNTRFYLTTLLGVNFAQKNNIPSLIIEHGSNHFTVNNKVLDYFGEKYEHFLTKKIKNKTDNFYGVSERCNLWLKHFNINASGTFYNSVDNKLYEKFKKSFFKEIPEDKIVISFAGRIIKEKGVEILLKSFQKLQNKYDNLYLIIAGDGTLLNELKRKYKNKNVLFTGSLSYERIMSLYNVTDIFAHPSMFPEGLPTTILEAGIMKCAVIGTDRGGTVEVISEEKFGLICAENQIDLEKKLETLINDSKKRLELANNLHKRIKDNFTWEITAKKVKKEMEKIINEKMY